MRSSDDAHTESQMTATKIQQVLGINDEEKTSSDSKKITFPNGDNMSGAKTDGDHLLEPVLLSNGKPLKGILKHRCHTDAKTHTQ